MSESTRMMIFSGSANKQLAHDVVEYLDISLGKIKLGHFSDGEIQVEILETVRGRDVFIIQPTCYPMHDAIIELAIISDALYRTSAARITAVIPYYGYARQDRRVRSRRVPISAKVIADILSASHVDRVLTIDLHSEQVQGFFDMPVDNIYAQSVLRKDIQLRHKNPSEIVVVSPDVGGVVRARAVAKKLRADLAIIDKRRPKPNEAKVMNIIGHIEGKICVMIDDLVDTAGTLCNAATALKERGALKVFAYATHPVFSGRAIHNIENSQLDEIVVTDTIPLSEKAQKCDKIRQLSVASMLAETILQISREESVSRLFSEEE